MNIRDIFKRKSDTISDLQAKYKAIEAKKADLEKKAGDLRNQSLRTEIDASEQLKEISEEISLSDVALSEVEKELQDRIEKKIQADFESLDADRQEYESQRKNLSRRAGKNIGRGVQNLENLNLSFAHVLGKLIRKEIISYTTDRRFKDQLQEFLEAYQKAINADIDNADLRSWKKDLQKVEQLRPGSAAAGRHIAANVKRLISA